MEHKTIDLSEGYLTVRVPGGKVHIAASQVDTRTLAPVVVVEVESTHKISPDGDGRLWSVDEPRTYGKPGEVVLRSRKPESEGTVSAPQ